MPTTAGRRRGHPGRRGVVDGSSSTRPGAGWPRAASTVERVVAVAVTGQWASTVPVDAAGEPVGAVPDVERHPRRRALEAGSSAGRCRATHPRALATWVRRSGGVPSTSGADPVGHMLHLDHDRPDVARPRPVVPRAGRLPGHAVHRGRRRLPHVDDRRLADRQPPARRSSTTTRSWSGWPAWTRPSCRRWCRRHRRRHGAARRRRRARHPGRPPQVVTGMPDLHAATVGSGCVARVRGPRLDRHLGVDQLPGARQEDRRDPADGHRSRPRRRRGVPAGQQPGQRGPVPAVVPRQRWSGPAGPAVRTTRSPRSRPPPRPGSSGVLFTPWLTGERSPVDDRRRAGGVPQRRRCRTTQADLARAVLEGVAFNLRWLLEAAEHFAGTPARPAAARRRRRPVGPLVPDRRRRLRPHRGAGRGAVAVRAARRGARRRAGARDITLGEVRALVPVDGAVPTGPAHRATYDRLFAEFPRLYRAQRRMFSRLNR